MEAFVGSLITPKKINTQIGAVQQAKHAPENKLSPIFSKIGLIVLMLTNSVRLHKKAWLKLSVFYFY
jgi:hypothetical protein